MYRSLANQLHGSVHGRGLGHHSETSLANNWIVNGSNLQTGQNFIGSIHVRAASLHTAIRASRGFPDANMKCDACGQTESLSHILQMCHCTAARGRDKRHDSLVVYLAKCYTEAGFEVLVEPTISTPAGIRRPDLFIYISGKLGYVID